MVSIAPFRGLLYNPKKVKDLYTVVAPPYDVITEKKLNILYERNPYNVVRLILSKDDHNGGKNRYQKAEEVFKEWVEEEILIRDEYPALYYYQQTYTLNGETRTRNAFITLMKLAEFGSGAIYPHERTLAKPKADRLSLITACNAHFSCVFSLYQDSKGEIDRILLSGKKAPPLTEINDDEGINNRLWRINDTDVLKEVQRKMSEKSLLIADGHHRYETALRYRDIMRERYPDYRGDESFNFVMMCCSNMNDEGLTVLPTHRLLHSIKGFNPGTFLSDSEKFFDIEELRFSAGSESEKRGAFLNHLEKKGKGMPTFGLCIKGEEVYRLLTLKDLSMMDRWVENSNLSGSKPLDLTVLHTLVVAGIIGIDEGSEARQENIDYVKNTDEAIESVRRGKHQMAFILNPPEIEKIKAIAAAGDKMPQKSTFFYPKLLTGLVINPIIPGERVSF